MALKRNNITRGNAGIDTERRAIGRLLDSLLDYDDSLANAKARGIVAQAALDEFKAAGQ